MSTLLFRIAKCIYRMTELLFISEMDLYRVCYLYRFLLGVITSGVN